jgi:lipopolysaccharide export system permease protein
MGIVTRYVIADVLKIFAVALSLLTALLIVPVLFKEARDQGLEPLQILRIIPYTLPETLRYTVPAAVLFAVSTVFGRMSGSNEIVALKSLGISPMAVMWPVLIVAFLLSLSTVLLNDVAISWGRANMKRIIVESVEEIAYSMLRTHRCFTAPNFQIIVKRVDGKRLIEPTITFKSGAASGGITLTAEEAELKSNPKENLMTITCRRGTLDVEGQARLRFEDTIERSVPLEMRDETGDPLPTHVPMSDLPSLLERIEQRISTQERSRAVRAAEALVLGQFSWFNSGAANDEAHRLGELRKYLYRLRTERHRRWSNGFSCLCFVLIGVPMAIRRRNADPLTSFFACFLPILLIYYPLLAFGVDQAKSGAMPPISVWLGNAILLVWGLWLLRSVIRY